jgi:hypothetical protein
VVDDEIDDDAEPDLVGVVHEVHELAERPVLWMHSVVVRDIVAVVAVRRWVERLQPQARHAEAGKVVEPPREPLEIANAVAVAVDVGLDVEAVNDRVLVPEVINHR